MMSNNCLIGVVVLLQSVFFVNATIHTKKWKLYHSWDGKEFNHRSNIVLSLDDENNNDSEESKAEIDITHIGASTTKEGEEEGEAAALFDPSFVKEWVEKHPNGFYQLQLLEDGVEEGDDDALFTSVPVCELLRANFREEIIVRLGAKASAMSFSYIPLVSPLAPKTCLTSEDEKKNVDELIMEQWNNKQFSSSFDTQRISYETATAGMTLRPVFPPYKPPPGITFLPRLNSKGKMVNALPGQESNKKGDPTGEGGKPEEQQGFMRRYWYIILPVMIMNLMGGGAPAEEGGEGQPQQGQEQSGGGGAQQSGGPAAASPAGGEKRRRGKRG